MNSLTDLLTDQAFTTVLAAVVTGTFAWLVARAGKKADVQSAINGAMTSLIENYQSTLEAERLAKDKIAEEARLREATLQGKVSDLSGEIQDLRLLISDQSRELHDLRATVTDQSEEIEQLTKAIVAAGAAPPPRRRRVSKSREGCEG